MASPAPGAVNFYQFSDAIWGSDRPGGIGGVIDQVLDWVRINKQFGTPAAILNRLFPYLFAAAGLILFVMLIWGAMEFMFGAANPKSADSGKQRITAALIGFFMLFCSYWFGQILQVIFGINIGI
jgi:hypothetical protein